MDELQKTLDEMQKTLDDQLDELEGINTKDTNLRWNKMGLDFWETMRLGV